MKKLIKEFTRCRCRRQWPSSPVSPSVHLSNLWKHQRCIFQKDPTAYLMTNWTRHHSSWNSKGFMACIGCQLVAWSGCQLQSLLCSVSTCFTFTQVPCCVFCICSSSCYLCMSCAFVAFVIFVMAAETNFALSQLALPAFLLLAWLSQSSLS